jgi:hypothetical protein
MRTNRQSSLNKWHTSVLLLLAALGVLLVMLTAGLLAERLQPMTGVEGNSINESGAGDCGIVLLGTTSPLSSRHITVSGADGNAWTLTTNTIDLFQSSYQNVNKQVNKRSTGEENVIAPGTSGSYTFYVKNTGRTLLVYKLWLEKEFQVNTESGESAELPVQVRLSSGTSESRTWLLGSSDTVWVDADTLKDIENAETDGESIPQDSIAGALSANESISYTLEWQWPFETGADENDILLGNSENAELTLQLNLIAEADESAAPTGGDSAVLSEGTETETPGPDNAGETVVRKDPNTADEGTRENGTTPNEGTADDAPVPDGSTADDGENVVRKDTNLSDDSTTDGNPNPDDGTVQDRPTPDNTEDDVSTMGKSRVNGTGNRFLWGWLFGLFFFIIILWRRITITGYLLDENGAYMEGFILRLEQSGLHKTKEAEVDEDGWFKIRRIPLGKKTLILKDKDDNEIARNELRLKRKGKLRIDDFLEIREKKEDNEEKVYTEFDMRYRITGFEIYLHKRSTSERMEIETDCWIAHTWFRKKYEPEEDEDEK